MIVRFSRRAARDLTEILAYVAERSPAGAVAVDAALQKSINFISDNPHGGKKTAISSLFLGIVTGYPYKIFYRAIPDAIEIVHIRHASRRPWHESN